MIRARENAFCLSMALLGAGVICWLGLVGFAWTDYDNEAAPAYLALVHGHAGEFIAIAPAYVGSLILRAPFALAPSLWGGGELAVFRAVSIPCVLSSVVLGTWLVAQMRAADRSRLARGLVLGLCVASPVVEDALELGHPEELLGAVLCVAAVVAAQRQHASWAGLLLGLAVANKAWALLAIGPVLLALDARRLNALVVATVVAGIVLAPVGLAMLGSGHAPAPGGMTATGGQFQPWQAWWWLGEHGHVVIGGDGHAKPGYRTAPGWISGITHPLIVLLAIPLCLAFLRARRGRAFGDELLLLALLLHLRCVLDPLNNVYYPIPCLYALLAWEALTRREPAVVTLGATTALWLVLHQLPRYDVSPDAQSIAYLALAVPAAAALALRVYAPQRFARLLRAPSVGHRRLPLGGASTP